MTLSLEEQLARSERRIKLGLQRVALEERNSAVLAKKVRRGEGAGARQAHRTRQKCILGYSAQRVLSDASLPVTVRNRLRELLGRHISEPDHVLVREWLAPEATR